MIVMLVDQQQTSYQLIMWGGFWNLITGKPANSDNYYDIVKLVKNSHMLRRN